MTLANLTEYDRIVYPSYTHPQTHPDRLAVIGHLFGLEPAPVQACRVLEVGCGDGTNLAPMAWSLPESQFVGIDMARIPLRKGQGLVEKFGLKNLRFVNGDVTQIDRQWGQFDYIIAHGFYSWVPREVRLHLLKVCRELLAPQGIAFVSYNALPGSHLRNIVREMMLFHVRGLETTLERTQQARALAQFLIQAQDTAEESRLWLKAELQQVLEKAPTILHHDDLAKINEPLYFTQFMEDASRQGLQYLAEADFFEMSDEALNDPVRQTLAKLAGNRLLREQYLDFLKCRRFRQTLLCHREARLQTEPHGKRISGFLVGSGAKNISGEVDLRPNVNGIFESPKGGKCQTDLPVGKAALAILGSLWPLTLPFEELKDKIRVRLAQAGVPSDSSNVSEETLCDFLLRLYGGGVVEFRTWLPPIATEAGVRPTVHPIARWQAANRQYVTSLFHIAVQVEDELGRCLLTWLDGTRERPELLQKVWDLLKSNNAVEMKAGGETEARKETEARLEQNLQKLAKLGLLVRQSSR